MRRNTDSRNRCPTWDMTEEELEKFYRGAGAATVVLDEESNIVECHYFQLGSEPDDEDEQQTYVKTVFPTAARQMDGMMSCTQFCEVPIRLAASDDAIAAHIERYGRLLAEQVQRAGGWPARFEFPEATTATGREALRLLVSEVALTTGMTVTVGHPDELPDPPEWLAEDSARRQHMKELFIAGIEAPDFADLPEPEHDNPELQEPEAEHGPDIEP